eukprot:CAMPEP_0175136532 /NCGR_PEP_ID=MMETSP0087-20121206/9330_1 /TAXON_ID=136419 /ORGANISM="Unknown Unknown, Strain D1" /LENGTH=143 /DNA_ID=CAMNT_0016419303 /DNA_START=197 /DNA_END=628 /DNA_ORIENTATION=-
MTLRGPTAGGAFAVWGGLFATYDCAITHVRRVEDPWNAISAGAATGGTLAIRSGWKAVVKNGIVGGVLLGMFEGINIMMQSMSFFDETPEAPQPPPRRDTQLRPPEPKERSADPFEVDFDEDAGDFGLGFEFDDNEDMELLKP